MSAGEHKSKGQPQGRSPDLNSNPKDWSWNFWPAVPLYPYSKRRTLRREVVADTIWTFDQLQGILYTIVPIRMIVVKLEAGGLLVYAPVAPTNECIGLVKELVAAHGVVKYIILPTSSGLELPSLTPTRCCFTPEITPLNNPKTAKRTAEKGGSGLYCLPFTFALAP